MSNFHTPEVVDCGSETELQVGDLNYLLCNLPVVGLIIFPQRYLNLNSNHSQLRIATATHTLTLSGLNLP